MFICTHLLCFCKQPALSASLSPQPQPHVAHGDGIFKDRRLMMITNPSRSSSSSSCGCIVHAVKEDSQQYEVDPDKAREALQKLDQQLQSLSNKQVPSPKIRVSDVKLTREQAKDTDTKLELSDSFLANLAGALFLFTIFYNILFYTVIKPSIDGS